MRKRQEAMGTDDRVRHMDAGLEDQGGDERG